MHSLLASDEPTGPHPLHGAAGSGANGGSSNGGEGSSGSEAADEGPGGTSMLTMVFRWDQEHWTHCRLG